jgi:hypothetical protein
MEGGFFMSVNFTPGPWQKNAYYVEAVAFNEKGYRKDICETIRIKGIDDVAEANANLISAAPELYWYCDHIYKVLTGRIKSVNKEIEHTVLLKKVTEALNKAEGRPIDDTRG